MNAETLDLLHDVVERLERSITARDCPAIVGLDGDRRLTLSDYDYLRDDETAEAFERRAAEHGRRIQARRWVIAVPLVFVIKPDLIAAREVSNHPLREGEQEVIAWTGYDRVAGLDYGYVPYTRRPNGEPVFDEPQMIIAKVLGTIGMPGSILLQESTSSDG